MDLHQAPNARGSTLNLTGPRAKNQSQMQPSGQRGGSSSSSGPGGSLGRMSVAPAAAMSTPSLGSTLNGSSGSLRVGQQQQQQQQPQQLQHRVSMGIVGGARPPRPRPSPGQMMVRPQQSGAMAGPGPRASMGPDGQSFELGPMQPTPAPILGPGRASYMPMGSPGIRPIGGNAGGNNGVVGLETRHSIHGGPGPGYRPAPSPRPMQMQSNMRPNMRPGLPPPGNQGGNPYPMPFGPPQQRGPPGAGGPRPRPPSMLSGPIMQPPPPALLFPNYQQQQQISQDGTGQPGSGGGSGVPYPPVPTGGHSSHNPQGLLPGDRSSRLSDGSGNSAAHGSVATGGTPGTPGPQK